MHDARSDGPDAGNGDAAPAMLHPGDADPASVDPDDAAPVPADAAEPPQIGFIPRITVGVFAETPALIEAMRRMVADRRMSRTACEVVEGAIANAIDRYRETSAPDLLIVESRLGADALFAALEELADLCPPGTRLIVVGHENDVTLYRRLLRFGVSDYLVPPIEPLGVIDSIARLFEEGDTDRRCKVTAFIGARGGAGSSMVAQNTAAAMARGCDASVLIADLDMAFGTAGLDLDIDAPQGVRDALEQGERLDGTLLDRLVTARDERMGLLAAPCNLGREQDPDPEAIRHLIDVARTITPHLLLDLPHCWTGWVRKALLAADEIVVTATPDLAALRNARNIFRTARTIRPNDPPPRVVLNQVGVPKRREVTAADFERVLHVAPTIAIRHDPAAFSAAAASGTTVAESGSGETRAAFDRLARLLTGRKEPEPQVRGLGRLFRPRRKAS